MYNDKIKNVKADYRKVLYFSKTDDLFIQAVCEPGVNICPDIRALAQDEGVPQDW